VVPVSAPDLETDDRAREAILRLLDDRGSDKTICPSDAARDLAGDDDFRPYMDPVREAAAGLVDAGRIVVTQKGEPVTIADAHGPIRLGLTDDREDER
jgi:Protein of unknown function (DUF3253)